MAEEYCWAITQRAVRLRCVGVWIASGLPAIYILDISDGVYTEIRPA